MESVITKEGKTIIVNAGYKATVSQDGILSKPEKINLKKMKRGWEK